MGEKRAAVNVEAIEARANAATAGPWWIRESEGAIGNAQGHVADVDADDRDIVLMVEARTDVPALCGALREQDAELAARPLTMTIERAKEITAQCLHNRMFTTVGLGKKTPLPECSLEEMLLANRMVSQHVEPEVTAPDGTKSRVTLMTVDPRGIAAAYALQNFGGSPYALLEAVGFTLKTKGGDDDDTDEDEEG